MTLRPLVIDDTDAVYGGVSNYDVIRWLGRIPYPYGWDDAVAFIARVYDEDLMVWGIEDAGGFVGVVGIDEELGYWLAQPAWGKGYGFEAAVAVLKYWFSDPERGSVESGHYDDNTRSRRILSALGFKPMGQRLRFARALSKDVMGTDVILTRESWAARQAFTVCTSRLVLRPWSVSDAPALAALVTPEVARMTGSMASDWSVTDAEAYIAARQWRGYPGFLLAIDWNGKMVGVIGCGGTPVSLMYALGIKYWGQGIASEAITAFLGEFFERFPIDGLNADCFEDNPASAHVLHKMGFEETGREMAKSVARLEPSPLITYALTRDKLRMPS